MSGDAHPPALDAIDAAVADAIGGWRCGAVGACAGEFARAVVGRAAPATPQRARALLFACSRLGAFAEQVGLGLDGALLSEAVIERFIVCGCDAVSPATRRTLRTNLRALARSLERYPQPLAPRLPREQAKAPYTEGEIDGYLRLAQAQNTRARRMRGQALVCLGAGAGIIAGELRRVRGTDVVCRSGGVLVVVSGRRARSVPVLYRYQQPLLVAAQFASERLIVGGREPGRRNVCGELCRALSGDRSLPRLEAGRLRSTWLCECAETTGLRAFMQAAGVRCSQRLGDLAAALPAATEPELVALLGGGA